MCDPQPLVTCLLSGKNATGRRPVSIDGREALSDEIIPQVEIRKEDE